VSIEVDLGEVVAFGVEQRRFVLRLRCLWEVTLCDRRRFGLKTSSNLGPEFARFVLQILQRLSDAGVPLSDLIDFVREFVVDALFDLPQILFNRFGLFFLPIFQVRVDVLENGFLDDSMKLARMERLEGVEFDSALAEILLKLGARFSLSLIGIRGSL
jgi:hypothetical protein